MPSTVIKRGTVVTADLTHSADVLIEGETIAAIGKDLRGDKVVDASACYLFPGGIDPHTHLEMRFTATTAYEDFASAGHAGSGRR
jgi:dihydropyrimidinase